MTPDDSDAKLPLPIVSASDEEALEAVFGSASAELTPDTAKGAAALWWVALADTVENRPALDLLSYNPSAWGDFSAPAALISTRSMLGGEIDCPEDANIKHFKFIEFAGAESGIAFDEAALDDVVVLTMVLVDGSSIWQAWGLSPNRVPTYGEVTGQA